MTYGTGGEGVCASRQDFGGVDDLGGEVDEEPRVVVLRLSVVVLGVHDVDVAVGVEWYCWDGIEFIS